MEVKTRTIDLLKQEYDADFFTEDTLTNNAEYENFELKIETISVFL